MVLSKTINKFVIADPKVCIGCATCMAACYQSSKERDKMPTARLVVTRTKSGTMPNQCRQCDNAPCVNVCLAGALSFGQDSVKLREEACIGCKMCVLACPFGAIRMEVDKTSFDDHLINPKQNFSIESEVEVKSVAVKCDLCSGLEDGPSCVKVCPTGALMFIDSQDIDYKISNVKAKNAVESFISTAVMDAQ